MCGDPPSHQPLGTCFPVNPPPCLRSIVFPVQVRKLGLREARVRGAALSGAPRQVHLTLKTHPLRHRTPETRQPVRPGEAGPVLGCSAHAPAGIGFRGASGAAGHRGPPVGAREGGLQGGRRRGLATRGSAWTERPLCFVPLPPTRSLALAASHGAFVSIIHLPAMT